MNLKTKISVKTQRKVESLMSLCFIYLIWHYDGKEKYLIVNMKIKM